MNINFLLQIFSVILQNASVDVPGEIELSREIRIPTFIDFDSIAGSSTTVFSFLAFLGSIATIGIVIFWIYKIVRLGVEGIQSEGKPEKIQELIKKLQNILLGAFMSFLFPIILSLIGLFAGIGTIFEWPRMFRSCPSGVYDYYFQAFLAESGEDAVERADSVCGSGSGTGGSLDLNLEN